ncbi:MAG: aspartate carbamoyltransferase regulatory subunit [Prevotellaceae bacterium]|jgi:aspartate carbamoyltransferase regulatory subunit|nr:aspartate carbamoyltransferase regulatory subunit [Prevotellaceae bacterium]
MEKELKVSALKNGTVIDHIPSTSLFKVVEILGLKNCTSQTTFGMNLESKRMGSKAIVKISDRFFETAEINRIALVAPQAKLNVIRDYEVVEKKIVELPDYIEGLVKCVNPQCVTNKEKVKTKFTVLSKKDVLLQCHYCEKMTDQDHLVIHDAIS